MTPMRHMHPQKCADQVRAHVLPEELENTKSVHTLRRPCNESTHLKSAGSCWVLLATPFCRHDQVPEPTDRLAEPSARTASRGLCQFAEKSYMLQGRRKDDISFFLKATTLVFKQIWGNFP